MRPIARQSARLANCQRLRASSRPRSPIVSQHRTFHAGASRLQDSTPPNGSSEHQRAIEEQREKERKAAEEAVRHEYNFEDGVVKKGGRQRPNAKKHLEIHVPRPPPLPEWFLKNNVLLVPEGAGRDAQGARQLRCVDAQTAHTLFHVPYYPVEAQEEKAKSELEEAAKQDQDEQAKKASIPGINMIGQDFFQQKFGGQIPPVLEADNELPLGFKIPQDTLIRDPLSWTLLETEASARAAMQTGNSTSHAAKRSDIHLHCPDSNAHDQMDQYVRDIAQVLRADLLRLDANDIADLTDEYVGDSNDSPGSFSTLGYDVYDGAAATGVGIRGGSSGEDFEEDAYDEQASTDEYAAAAEPMNLGHFSGFDELRKALGDKKHDINKMLGNFGVAGVSIGLPPGGGNPFAPAPPTPAPSKASEPSEYISWDDARLFGLLSTILDAPVKARSAGLGQSKQSEDAFSGYAASVQGAQDETAMPWSSRVGSLVGDLVKLIGPRKEARSTSDTAGGSPFKLEDDTSSQETNEKGEVRRTVVHIRDLKQILANKLGESIIKRLVRVVQKRRRDGEEVVVIGTTAEDVTGPLDGLLDAYEDSPFRLIVVPPLFGMTALERQAYHSTAMPAPLQSIYQAPSYDRIAEVNMRHITRMLIRLGHRDLSTNALEASFKQLHIPGTHILSERVLPQDQIQRLVLTAIGLSQSYAKSNEITPIHIALATAVLSRADHAVHSWTAFSDAQRAAQSANKGIPFGKNAPGAGAGAQEKNPGQLRIERIKKDCNPHETRLLAGVVDPSNIKTGFKDVHATPESIEALKSMTTLSLMRPDAFEYGVLANDRLTGLLLYGPPGTGKTLLAKAVAKESGATVLEVSGAQIYEKYVGEGEKMVRGVFSLAKKLSPCVVFIDEADAIFGSRGGSGNRNTHREIINQFLREWDGMDNNSVFMMVATNRPFDLDDAVLRRLPRRLLVDLPVAKDRESILGIHLRHETLDPAVDLEALAKQTPLYSGSDLKNVCVSAAIAAVQEENELVAKHKNEDKEFKLPARRTLTPAHFDKAIAEISASINEDMSSLTAIKKFDEQFGDRKGRKKRSGVGFGIGGGEVDEEGARVRSGP